MNRISIIYAISSSHVQIHLSSRLAGGRGGRGGRQGSRGPWGTRRQPRGWRGVNKARRASAGVEAGVQGPDARVPGGVGASGVVGGCPTADRASLTLGDGRGQRRALHLTLAVGTPETGTPVTVPPPFRCPSAFCGDAPG